MTLPFAGDALPAMMNNCVLLQVNTSTLGNSKSVSTEYVTAKANKDMLSLNKKLLESKQLNAINAHIAGFRRYLKKRSIVSKFKGGCYVVPLDRAEEIEAKYQQFLDALPPLIDAFMDVYDLQVDKAKDEDNLGDLWERSDYPPAERVRQMFAMSRSYFEMNVPDNLNRVMPNVYLEQKRELMATLQQAQDEVRWTLRGAAEKLMNGLVQMLQEGVDGNKKVIRQASVAKVRAFIAEFREIDVTEDTELQGLISQINALTDGLDCKQLRESDELTNSMLKAAESLQSEFEQMMADAPVRMVTLEDDDE
jgi:hypothetical protein